MINAPEFIFKDIDDVYIRENFKRLNFFIQQFPLFRGQWAFFEIKFTLAVTELDVPHGLSFTPQDIILTGVKDAGVIGTNIVTFNYDKFDSVNINLTTTDACTLRFFAGSYKEESARTGR